jgi:hypothetical protein
LKIKLGSKGKGPAQKGKESIGWEGAGRMFVSTLSLQKIVQRREVPDEKTKLRLENNTW